MKSRIALGLITIILFELIVGSIFYLILTKKSTSTVYIFDIVKIVAVALFLFIIQTIIHFLMSKIGGNRFHHVLHIFFYLGIVVLFFCIIYSFTDIYFFTGVLFLTPILVSCVIWW